MVKACRSCAREVPRLASRGLCGRCRSQATRAGTLDNWPRLIRTAAELIEDVEWIIGWDNPESIARRMGYATTQSLYDMLRRNQRDDLVQQLIDARQPLRNQRGARTSRRTVPETTAQTNQESAVCQHAS